MIETMFERTPKDTQQAYERFLRKGEYEKAYRCLQNLLKEFPGDEEFLERTIDLCLTDWDRPDLARRWLKEIIKIRTVWIDYLELSRQEALDGNLPQARQYMKKTRTLLHQVLPAQKAEIKNICAQIDRCILLKQFGPKMHSSRPSTPGRPAPIQPKPTPSSLPKSPPKEKTHTPAITTPPKPEIPEYSVQVIGSPLSEEKLKAFLRLPVGTLTETKLTLDFERLLLQGGFNELLCLNSMTGVDKYWYQIETAKKVLKHFHGRVLLCDEVGLGKTIEAAMIVKEYVLRRMAKNVLILAPPSLVSQWKEEMQVKFGLAFTTTDEDVFAKDPQEFWKIPLIIASLNTAKTPKNLEYLQKQFYDIVIVDEAHHLRNRATQSWQMVNMIQKKFILLLTATPVQNHLLELYNLITLLKPGQFKTEKIFKQEFLRKGQTRTPANKEKLRELLKDVMIRNTRSAIDLKLPKRFATTMRLDPMETEKRVYAWLNDYLRNQTLTRFTQRLLLTEAGSSPPALRQSLLNLFPAEDIKDIVQTIENDQEIAKGHALLELLRQKTQEKKIIFTQYLKSMEYLVSLLTKQNIPFACFQGGMSAVEKDTAIQQFKQDVPVLISTESGGEGRNIQFCNTIINFDLPWNPMRIEQRIGRLHRIGQNREVFIFNLSVKGTIEDHMIDILDHKINMFEMVIGEIEPILGHISQNENFEDVILEIWKKSKNEEELQSHFEQLGEELLNAKQEYLGAKALDEEIFSQDYEL